MGNQKPARKRAPYGVLFLILLFSACSAKPSCPHWKSTTANSVCPKYKANKCTFTTEKLCANIQLELTYNDCDGYLLYLNTFSVPLPDNRQNPGMIPVFLQIQGVQTEALAHRLQGGQRLLLPDSLRNPIINALNNEQTVTLRAGRYSGDITACGWTPIPLE